MSIQRTPPNSFLNIATDGTPTRHKSDPTLNIINFDSDTGTQSSINFTRRNKRKCKDLSSDNDMEELKKLIGDLKIQQESKFEIFCAAFKKIEDQNSEIKNSLEFLTVKYDEVLGKIGFLQKENDLQKSKIIDLENKIELIERKSLAATIEIRNVPINESENKQTLCELVQKVGSIINQPIHSNDIRDIYRVKSTIKDSAPIVAELNTVFLKEAVIRGVKTFNKQNKDKLNSKHLQFTGPDRLIYVSERLTKRAKRLFYLAKEFAKANGYEKCWISYGKVYIKKTNDTAVVRVDSEDSFLEMKMLGSTECTKSQN